MSRSSNRGPHFSLADEIDEESLRELLEDPPDDATEETLAEWHALLGLLLVNRDMHGPGILEARKALDLEPGTAIAHYVLALALADQPSCDRHDREVALGHAEEAARLEPDDESYQIQLGFTHLSILREDGPDSPARPEAALSAALTAIAIDGDNASALLLLAQALEALGRYDEARTAFTGAIARHPREHFLHLGYGAFLLGQSDDVGARAAFAEAERLDPSRGPSHDAGLLARIVGVLKAVASVIGRLLPAARGRGLP
jgi:tetratricopeptide (TPR) repeat protein